MTDHDHDHGDGHHAHDHLGKTPIAGVVAEAQRIAREHNIEHARIQVEDAAIAAAEKGAYPSLSSRSGVAKLP